MIFVKKKTRRSCLRIDIATSEATSPADYMQTTTTMTIGNTRAEICLMLATGAELAKGSHDNRQIVICTS